MPKPTQPGLARLQEMKEDVQQLEKYCREIKRLLSEVEQNDRNIPVDRLTVAIDHYHLMAAKDQLKQVGPSLTKILEPASETSEAEGW